MNQITIDPGMAITVYLVQILYFLMSKTVHLVQVETYSVMSAPFHRIQPRTAVKTAVPAHHCPPTIPLLAIPSVLKAPTPIKNRIYVFFFISIHAHTKICIYIYQ